MTNEQSRPSGDRILARHDAPEHGPDFWSKLDDALAADASPSVGAAEAVRADHEPTATMPALPQVVAVTTAVQSIGPPPVARKRRSPVWAVPVAAAAAVVIIAALFFTLSGDSTDRLDLAGVSAEATAEAATPAGAEAAGAEASAVEPAGDDEPAEAGDTAASDGDPATGGEPESTDGAGGSAGQSDASDGDPDAEGDGDAVTSESPDAADAPPAVRLEIALGAVGEPAQLPLDGGLPQDSDFLANWPQRDLTWFAVNDPDGSCSDATFGEIRYVNASGITQDVRYPQPTYSGDISHFAIDSAANLGAWLVTCGTQAELFVATLEPTGAFVEQQLVWFGEASAGAASVSWDDGVVDLASFEPGGNAFSVSYDPATGLLSRNGGPSRIILEEGAPAERSLTPLAATPDAGLTYFAGTAPAGTISACAELFGSGRADTLWLRQGEGQWQVAAIDTPTGTVTAAALRSDATRFAFADVCAGESGRVVIGRVLDDGRIEVTSELDLTPFVPGTVGQLHWVDDETLRIETVNQEFGFGIVRFDYDLSGTITQID